MVLQREARVLEPITVGLKYSLHLLLAVWTSANYFISLNLGFIYEMVLIINNTFLKRLLWKTIKGWHLAQFLAHSRCFVVNTAPPLCSLCYTLSHSAITLCSNHVCGGKGLEAGPWLFSDPRKPLDAVEIFVLVQEKQFFLFLWVFLFLEVELS